MGTWWPRQPANLPVESFQGLLLQLRGRTGLSQAELAQRVGRHTRSIQGWESGVHYPNAESLQALLLAYLTAAAFTTGSELAEASAVWAAALRQAPRLRVPFDATAFAELGRQHSTHWATGGGSSGTVPQATTPPFGGRPGWGEAPSIENFHGRVRELGELRRWVLEERCRVLVLFGMGGIGKTTLAARLAEELAPNFETLYWRSLRDALSPAEWLGDAIGFVSAHQLRPPDAEDARLALLLDLLRERPSLLVLDNFETVLEPGQRDGRYRDSYAGFGTILRRFGESRHQSCLLLTSREAPALLARLEAEHAAVRSLQLGGLATDDARALLRDKLLLGDDESWDALVEQYAGSGLALRIAGETIRHVFGGDITAFLGAVSTVFGDIRVVLDEQIARLSDLEQMSLRWLAVEREEISFAELVADLAPVGSASVLEAVEALRRRGLLAELRVPGHKLTLQSVVLEHVTEQLVEDVVAEIGSLQPDVLLSQPLVKATAKDYVRHFQERSLAAPIIERLVARYAGEWQVEQQFIGLLSKLRARPRSEQGYGPGNVVNLLLLLRGDLGGVDLSGLELRQVSLRDVEARDAVLVDSHLWQSTLGDAFDYPMPVALSGDGAYVAAGTAGGEVLVWRASDRTLITSVPRQTSVIMSVALSGDGQLLASGSLDGSVKLWEARTGRLLANLAGHSGGVWGVALSVDKRMLASGGQDGRVRLWELATGRLMAALAGQTGGVTAVALSGDQRLVVSGGQDGTVRLWEVATGHLVLRLEGRTGAVMAVALSDNGQVIASGGADGTARLWAAPGGELLATLAGHTDQIWGVALSGDGRLLASSSLDGSVKLWASDDGSLTTTLLGHAGVIMGVALSGDGRIVASAGHDGTVRLWEVMSGRLLASLQGRADQIFGAALGSAGQLVAGGGHDGAVRLWEPATGQLLAALVGHSGTVWGVALSGDGRLVASGGNDGTVRLWDSASAELLQTLPAHSGAVWGVALSGDGRLVASGGGDGAVRLWEPGTGQLLAALAGHRGGVTGVALSADGQWLASSGYDGMVRLWRPATGDLVVTMVGHTGAVWGVAISADGRVVASGGADGTSRLWEAASGQLLATLTGHSGLVRAVALNADGQVLVSGSIDGTLRLWETRSGRLLTSLAGHSGLVRAVALSGDGRVLVSASTDGTLRVWDASSGTALRTLRSDRRYERMDISRLTGVTPAQRGAMLALGARDRG